MGALPELSQKQCACCRRVMSTSEFGSLRGTKDGFRPNCRFCCNLDKRTSRFKKYGYARPELHTLPSTNHHFKDHNDQVVSLGLLRQDYVCLGLDVVSHSQYRVEFSMIDFLAKLEVYEGGRKVYSMTDGKSDAKEFKKHVLAWLYEHNIRLEKNELDLHNSLREVYFI